MIQTTSTSVNYILSTGSAGTYNVFGVCFNCGSVMGRIGINIYNVGYYPTTGNKVINGGLWHTVLVTYDGTTLLIYVDGILDSTITNWNTGSTSTIASTLNTVGNSGNYLGQYVNGDHRWIGKLKNVQFYDYVITNTYALGNSYQLAGSSIYTSGI